MPIWRLSGCRILAGLVLVVFLAALTLTGCGDDSGPVNGEPPQAVDGDPPEPVDQEMLDRMAAELEGRSFRQFHPPWTRARAGG